MSTTKLKYQLEQILGRFVGSKLKGLTSEGAMEALKSMEGEQGFMIINIFDHGADLLMVGQQRPKYELVRQYDNSSWS